MKKKVLVAFVVVLLFVSAAVGVLVATNNFDSQFIIKDEKLTAAYLNAEEIFASADSEDVFKIKLKETVGFFSENGINTVIVPFNSGAASIVEMDGYSNVYDQTKYLKGKDIVRRLKSELAKNDIQLILSVSCLDFLDAEVSATVEALNKEYALGGILLTDYNLPAKNLKIIKTTINKRHKNFWFAIERDAALGAEEIQPLDAIDFYIFNKIDEAEYRRLKQGIFKDEKILFSYKAEKFLSDLFLLSNFSQLDGTVLTQYTGPQQDIGVYKSMMNTQEPLQTFNFVVDTQFKIAYPATDISTYYSGIFVTGTATPGEKVFVNGEEAAVSDKGIFGKFVELSMGDNIVTVEQAGEFIQHIVTKKQPAGGQGTPRQNDKTVKAESGQKIETTGILTSILSSKDDDSRIMDGVPAGTQFEVVDSETTIRGNFYTWAYKLSNGSYILAKNVKWINEDQYTKPVLNSATVAVQENKDEILMINSTGSPGIVSVFDDYKVQFTFLNTTFDSGFNIAPSALISSATIEQVENNTVLTLNCVPGNEIWGYHSERKDGQIEIYLKNTPRQSIGEKPLQGVVIMLDAGHGAKDTGAPAVGGISGPTEKDLNLAVSLATRVCLEKLGATVLMTRDDDTFFTLDERRDSINLQKPDLFLAQHHNSLEMTTDGSQAFGTEVYYFTPQSKAVAEVLSSKITDLTGRKNRGEKFGYFYVTRTDIAPSVLIEYGFVVNPLEYSNLYTDIDIYKAAFGTAQAVLDVIPE